MIQKLQKPRRRSYLFWEKISQPFRILYGKIPFVMPILLVFIIFTNTTVFAQTNWVKYSGNPVIFYGPEGSWDDIEISPDYVIYQDGTYRMWYDGTNAYKSRNTGLATSSEGINWIKYSGNPVFATGPEGSWDDFRVAMGSIIVKDNIYHMWYAGCDGTKISYWYGSNIGYATSTDSGVTWIKYPSPVLVTGPTGEWDDYSVFSPWVISDNDTLKMWYDGFRTDADGIGYAWSLDGINWTKYNDPATQDFPYRFSDPVLLPSKSWENKYMGYPCVIKNNDQFEMWYSGFTTSSGAIGYAISRDGINWNKFEGNPVVDVGPSGSWDGGEVISARVFLINSIYKMWYGGYYDKFTRIGYATSNPTEVNNNLQQLPTELILKQNYPNPFNPNTTIEFTIPKKGKVRLSILNLLGEEVKVLLSETKDVGFHSIEFNASSLPSGVYFYQLKAENFIQTKKMILMK